MRLADVILNQGLFEPRNWPRSGQAALIESSVQVALRIAHIVEATPVYQFCRTGPSCQPLYDLPCCAPPHEVMFMEWMQENGKRCGTLGISHGGPFRIGLQEPSNVIGEGGYRKLLQPDVGLSGVDAPSDDMVPMWLSNHLPNQAAWDRVRWTWGVGVFQEDKHRVCGPISTVMCALDEWGRLIDTVYEMHMPTGPDVDLHPLTLNPFTIFMQTINFMQCANIETVYVDPPAALSRKHRKKGRLKPDQDLVRYHELRIRMKGPAEAERSRSLGSQGLVGFHSVRGEFHHYGDCCPGMHPPKGLLFGKHTGRWFVPSHVRGNPERGTIKKDYVIEPVDDSADLSG